MGKEIYTYFYFDAHGNKLDEPNESLRYVAIEDFACTMLTDLAFVKENYDKMPEESRSADPLMTLDPVWVHPNIERQLSRQDRLDVDAWRRRYITENPDDPCPALVLDEFWLDRYIIGDQAGVSDAVRSFMRDVVRRDARIARLVAETKAGQGQH